MKTLVYVELFGSSDESHFELTKLIDIAFTPSVGMTFRFFNIPEPDAKFGHDCIDETFKVRSVEYDVAGEQFNLQIDYEDSGLDTSSQRLETLVRQLVEGCGFVMKEDYF